MLQPIERVNNSSDENNLDSFDEYLEASFNAPDQFLDEQPENYTNDIDAAEIDRLSSLSDDRELTDDQIYDWDVPVHVSAGSEVPEMKVPVSDEPLIDVSLQPVIDFDMLFAKKAEPLPITDGITEEFTTVGVTIFLLRSDLGRFNGSDAFNAHSVMKLANDVCDFKYQIRERLLTDQISIIEAVNAAYSWTDMLEHYGYKYTPIANFDPLKLAWVPPESLEDPEIDNDTPTVFLMPADDDNLPDKTPMRYFSLGGKDICGLKFEHLDKFDFLCIRGFGGNQYEALLSLTNEFPQIKEHNRQVFNKIREGV